LDKAEPATPGDAKASDDEASAKTDTPSQPPVDEAAGWSVFTSEEGGFAVEFPGEPIREVEQDEFGVDTHSYTAVVDEAEAAYTVMYTDFTDEDLADGPKAVLDGITESLGEDLKSSKEITLDDHPGMQYVMQFDEDGVLMEVVQRVFLVNKRMYQTIVGVPAANPEQAKTDRFLDSFKLTAVPTATAKPPAPTTDTTPPDEAPAEPSENVRTWTDATGQFRVEAELIEIKDGMVTLKRTDGNVATVPVAKLSQADQDYLRQMAGSDLPEPTAPTKWENYVSKEAGFSADFPGKPEHVEEGDEDIGITHTYSAMQPGTDINYMVMYDDLDEDSVAAGPKAIFEGVTESLAEMMTSKKDVTVSGHPGMEYLLEFEEDGTPLVIRNRVYVIGIAISHWALSGDSDLAARWASTAAALWCAGVVSIH